MVLFNFYFFASVTLLGGSLSLFPGPARHSPDPNHLPENKPHQRTLKGRTPGSTEVKMASSHLWEMNDVFLLIINGSISPRRGEGLTENHFQRSSQSNCLHKEHLGSFWTPSGL